LSFSGVMLLGDDMVRPSVASVGNAMLRHVALWGDR